MDLKLLPLAAAAAPTFRFLSSPQFLPMNSPTQFAYI